jgi:hypothetical protein
MPLGDVGASRSRARRHLPQCTLSSRPFGKTAVDREVLRAVPVREYGAEQPVVLAVDPVGEVEGVGIAVTAADPKPDKPKPAWRAALAESDRDRPTEFPGRRIEGVDPAIEIAKVAALKPTWNLISRPLSRT